MVVISAIFRNNQYFFRFLGGWFRQQLLSINWFFVQDEASAALLKAYGFDGVIVSGDTRFDRVWRLRESSERFPEVAAFVGDDPVLIAGSTWPKDEQALKPLMKDKSLSVKFIIAPHEVNKERLKYIEALVGEESVRLSRLTAVVPGKGNNQPAPKVLIIDSIGKLSHLYQYGNIAFIGGGFGRGIHNILEAATFGLPVFFGPNYQKFAEARELISLGGAFRFETADELKQQVKALLTDKQRLQQCTDICLKYVESKKGATDVIIQHLGEWLH